MLQSYRVHWRLRIYEELSCTCCVAVGTARAPVGAHVCFCMCGPRQIHARCVCGFFQGPSMLHCTLKWVHMDHLSIDKRFIDHERYLERRTRLIGTLGMGRERPSTRVGPQELLRCRPRHNMCMRVLHRCTGATAHDNSATSKLSPGPGQGRGVRVAPNTGDPQIGVPGAVQSHLPHKRFTPVSQI